MADSNDGEQMTRYIIENWKPLRTDNGIKATFICPECNHERIIGTHDIDDDGNVTPSVVCSCGCGCGFHEFVTLKGWMNE